MYNTILIVAVRMMLIIHFTAFLQDIGTVYQIFADEVLGSGQFGVVYGGMKIYAQ